MQCGRQRPSRPRKSCWKKKCQTQLGIPRADDWPSSSQATAGTIKLFDVESAQSVAVGGGANDRGPAWSPDGKQLLFTSNRGGDAELYVMDADGSNAVNLTRHPAYDADGAWSPDGKKIAFTSNRTGAFRLYVMKRDGTDLVRRAALDRRNLIGSGGGTKLDRCATTAFACCDDCRGGYVRTRSQLSGI